MANTYTNNASQKGTRMGVSISISITNTIGAIDRSVRLNVLKKMNTLGKFGKMDCLLFNLFHLTNQ